jgi:hypothetical protein
VHDDSSIQKYDFHGFRTASKIELSKSIVAPKFQIVKLNFNCLLEGLHFVKIVRFYFINCLLEGLHFVILNWIIL